MSNDSGGGGAVEGGRTAVRYPIGFLSSLDSIKSASDDSSVGNNGESSTRSQVENSPSRDVGWSRNIFGNNPSFDNGIWKYITFNRAAAAILIVVLGIVLLLHFLTYKSGKEQLAN